MSLLDLSVLYAEDDLLLRETTARHLSKIVKTITKATNGSEALELYSSIHPQIVITDIQMPIMDGLTLSKRLLEIDKSIPIIIISSHDETRYLKEAIEIGVQAFLIKPAPFQLLKDSILKISREITLQIEIEKNINRIKTLLDFQENMVIMTDGDIIYEVNRSFLEFTGFHSIDHFHKTYSSISEIFILLNQHTSVDQLFDEIINNGSPKVMMTNSKTGDGRIFLVKGNKIPNDNLYILSFTDITEIENKTLSLELKANVDNLTKIFNRQKFEDFLKNEFNRVKHEKSTFSLIMFDVDFFKKINDTYGHDIGDEVLQQIANAVNQNIRQSDIFARWGGEEFMILVPYTNESGAIILCEKIRKRIETEVFSKNISVTISLGISEYIETDTIETIVKRTDEALYLAKRSGRNRTEKI